MITLAEKLLTGSGAGVLEVNGYVEFVSSTPMMITPKYTNSEVKLLYSLDGTTWVPIANGATTPSANIIYFIGSATGTKRLYSYISTNNAWTFTGATNLECNGKLDRLLQDDLGGDNDILTIGANCFNHMFYSQTSLISLDDDCLQATTLANYCYYNMFSGCTSLTTAPVLPAMTLANYCYAYMFQGCTGLTAVPSLPATTLAIDCYTYMFQGCTGLTAVSSLPATTLANNCYYSMFSNCTSLTTAPALQATTLANNCYYNMFRGCTSLTTAPVLPAMTLANYCYYNMFFNCTGLTTAPALQATTLATECYSGMFYDCSNLTILPALPATTVTTGCYNNMFTGCTKIKVSTTLTGIYDTAYRIPTSGTGTAEPSALTSVFYKTGGTFTGTPDINKTYYTENTPV